MGPNSNPAGSEAHEVSPRCFDRFPRRLLGNEGTTKRNCAKGAVMWSWRIVRKVHNGRAGLVRQT